MSIFIYVLKKRFLDAGKASEKKTRLLAEASLRILTYCR
jgi:hypothetical protein